jgi:LmbE family N-acetylglucosaminyl deacetylase
MKILAFFAHPDDEAFGPAGTLARYAQTGHTVRLVTMTRGEAGSLGPARHLTRPELARLRSQELRCSADALHLSGLNICHLPDGKLAELPAEQGLTIVRHEIKTFLPDALITFHAAGISGHPDHRTVARWCLQAVEERAHPPRLFAYGISAEQARRASHRKLTPIPDDEITHVIDVSRYLEYKFAAIRCHQSQSEAWERMKTIEGGIESYLRNEHFSQVWPPARQQARSDRLTE